MSRISTQPESYLPLTEVTYFILLCLVPGASHGYAIMKSVQHLSAGRVRLSTGTLYGALQRLLDQGWITQIDEPEDSHPGRARRVYRLGGLGMSILKAEIRRLNSLVAAAQPLVTIKLD